MTPEPAVSPIEGKPVRFPPGHVAIRLDESHKSAYRRLYSHYQSILAGLPVLRERDFDGRTVKITEDQLTALNLAFAGLAEANSPADNVFAAQEAARKRLFKRLQYLS